MKQTNWDGKEVLLAQVAGVVKSLTINDTDFGYQLLNHVIENGADWNERLPPGYWQFAFASPLSPTEEEAAKYVGWAPTDPKLYREYKKDDADSDYYDFTFRTANESLHSRIKSEGFPHPERVVLLTKK